MKKVLDKVLGIVLVVLMGAIVMDVTWQVISRYLLNSPSSFTEELARFLLIWIGVLGAAYVSGQRGHLAITILQDNLSGKRLRTLNIFLNLLIILFAIVAMVIGGSRLAYLTYYLGQTSAAMGIPLALIYGIIPVSGALIVAYKVNEIIHPKLMEHHE